MRARDAIRQFPVTIRPDQSLTEAARRMDHHRVGSLLVVDDGALIGIVTDRDIVVRGMARGLTPDCRIDHVMTTDVTTLDANADLRDALPLLACHSFRRLPLLDDGFVVGVLSIDELTVDLVRSLDLLTGPVSGQLQPGHVESVMPVPVA